VSDYTVNLITAPAYTVNVGDFGALSADIIRARLEAPSTVAVPNGSSATLASVDSTDYKAISWDVYLVHTDGRRYQSRIDAHLNTAGTDADYSERGTDDVGDWTGTITADLDSGNIRLLVEGTELNWTGYAVRNFMRA